MPTNKLWIEHTERAAWDSVEALRERLAKAEGRLQALAAGVEGVPRLLDLLDEAKQKYAPGAQGHDDVVAKLLERLGQLQSELDAAKTPEPTVVTFAAPPPRPPLDSEDLDERRPARADDDELDLATFTRALQRRQAGSETTRDLERLLSLAEDKLDDMTEAEGTALRDAAVELALLAASIYGASRSA